MNSVFILKSPLWIAGILGQVTIVLPCPKLITSDGWSWCGFESAQDGRCSETTSILSGVEPDGRTVFGAVESLTLRVAE